MKHYSQSSSVENGTAESFPAGPLGHVMNKPFHGGASVSNATQDDSDEGGSVISALTCKEIIPAGYKLSSKC